MQHPAQSDLLPGAGRGFGESESKLLNQGIPRRYQRSSVHAGVSDVLRDNNYIRDVGICFVSTKRPKSWLKSSNSLSSALFKVR